MIVINGIKTEKVTGVSAIGHDRLSIVMADDLAHALEVYQNVTEIEAERLERVDVYRATGEKPAEIISIYRQPERKTLTVTLTGIALVGEVDDE